MDHIGLTNFSTSPVVHPLPVNPSWKNIHDVQLVFPILDLPGHIPQTSLLSPFMCLFISPVLADAGLFSFLTSVGIITGSYFLKLRLINGAKVSDLLFELAVRVQIVERNIKEEVGIIKWRIKLIGWYDHGDQYQTPVLILKHRFS